MKRKRILAWVLTLCLLFGTLSPAANAASVGASNTSQTASNSGTSSKLNDLLVSAGQKLGLISKTNDEKLSYSNGQWLVTSADGITSVAKESQLPDHVQALRSAEKYFAKDEFVAAFIVLEDAPTVEQYRSIHQVPQSETDALNQKQDALIRQIEGNVLNGSELDVISQFTYLTNSVVVNTEFGNLEAIAAQEGVKSVFISPVYSPATVSDTYVPYTTSSGIMTGIANTWNELGYTGKGMTIAVLDTGLDLDHPSFAAAPEGAAWTKEYVQEMLDKYDLNAESLYRRGTLTADKVYSHEKVPFIFNYAMGTTNVLHGDGLGDHGTHVAGIAAANNVEDTGVVGMAPDAQIIAMKVFNSSTGGSNMYDLVAALEDCITLGVDVVNMSLGSAAGFCESNIPEIDSIFERIAETDMIVDIAAGNDGHSMNGSLYGNYTFPTDHIDNATVASPSTYANAISVGSIDNETVYAAYYTLADGTIIHYMQSVEYLYGYVSYSLEYLANKTLEYVILDGLGEAEDFFDANGNSLVEGKIAVVKRGTISFAEKALNAEAAGALACIIWNQGDEYIYNFGMSTTYTDPETGTSVYPSIPTALITKENGQLMADATNKTATMKADLAPRKDPYGGQMSSYSGWGVSPELGLLPDLVGVGGNVYSCYDGGEYGIMSGTSMATPQVAGLTAVVLQYLKNTYPQATDTQIRQMVDALMMSTAVPVIDSDTGLEASPRQQGAGLVNAYNAITAKAYLSVAGTTRAKAELGDNANGEFSFTFTVNNLSNKEKTYTLSSSLLCEDYITDDDFPGEYFIATYEHKLDESGVTFSQNTVTVPANSTVDVTVTIKLTEADKQWINTYFPSGNYVEGYIYLTPTSEDDVRLNMPFLGFYQDWTDAPIFDTGFWYDNGFWGQPSTEVEAMQYYNALFTSLGASNTDWALGFNPYADSIVDENGNVVYNPENNVLSPNGDGVLDNISNYYLSLMRNVKWLHLTYTDAAGNVLDEEILDYLNKTMYNSAYGSTLPFVYSWEYNSLYDFTDAEGNYLPDGTKLTLTISATLPYGDETDGVGSEVHDKLMEIPITIDTVAPVIVGTPVESTADGHNYLTVTIKDAHPACVALMNRTGSMTYAKYSDADMTDNGDGTYNITVDVTGLGDNFVMALCDYGCNENYVELTWSQSGTNNPEVDLDALYAYRIYDLYDGYYYGSDYMYGWGVMDKETGEFTMQRSDAFEYYAITSAEYVDGIVFATDAGHNLVRMEPGLWNREWICNLGVNVVDMAFDDVSGKMYLATKTTLEDGYTTSCGLYTVDLLTGELTKVTSYSGQYSMPWAMTFVDGKLYAIKNYYTGFFEVDLTTGNLTQVVDAEGNKVIFKYFNGATSINTSAGYTQSMTYSKEDGKIYWAYHPNNSAITGALFVIDPSDWSYTNAPTYQWSQEYAVLLTLEDTNYKLPASSSVTNITLDTTDLIMVPGQTQKLSASTLPWNAPLSEEIVWTSSDNSVATVIDGKVTAIGAGNATISVSYGTISAICSVTVVDINGTLYGYNSYSDDGNQSNWFSLDLSTMISENLDNFSVEMSASEYNGHDKCIYGYDLSGQFYRLNTVTGECDEIGVSTGKIVGDMAYSYIDGFMYATIYDQNTWTTTLCRVDLSTGILHEYAIAYNVYLTLACDMYGQMYATDTEGSVYALQIIDNSDPDSGIGGWEPLSADGSGDASDRYIEGYPLIEGNSELSYQQSMCYDHNNNVLLWSCPDEYTIYWVELGYNSEDGMPYMISLGAPENVSTFQYLGLFVIPQYIPDLYYQPVESVEASDIVLIEGVTRMPETTIYPLNATNRTVTYVSSDPTIAKIDNGAVVAVAPGTVTITGTLVDAFAEADWEQEIKFSFTVTVKSYSDNLFAYQMYDLLTGDSGYWAGLDAREPELYDPIGFVADDRGTYYLVYAGEYVETEGRVFAYGYNMDDPQATWQFLSIDPADGQVVDTISMPTSFSTFVYDMAFDYTTGTMYAVAGPNSNVSDLYYVDMETGNLIPCMSIEGERLMGVVVTRDGTVYTTSASVDTYDDLTWTTTSSNALLYKMDVKNGTYEKVMDTGVKSNLIAPMTYDYDTGYIYWNAVYRVDFFSAIESCFCLIDLSDESVCTLGRIGESGSQITGLVCIADHESYPEIPDKLCNLTITDKLLELSVNDSGNATLLMQPYNVNSDNAEIRWESSDPEIASVDDEGTITAHRSGKVTITVTVTYGGVTQSSSCPLFVYGQDDYLITYDRTNMGFASISRLDPTQSKMLTQNEEVGVAAMESINGIIYGYDDNGNLFRTSSMDNYNRKVIGNNGVTLHQDTDTYTYYFQVRDMAWDAANQRMLVVGLEMAHVDYGYSTTEGAVGGCKIYEADLTTGKLTELVSVVDSMGEPDHRILMLAVDNDGQVYVMSYLMSYISKLDLETGLQTDLTTFQSQGASASDNGNLMAMTYDEFSNSLYLSFSETSSCYELYRFDLDTTALTRIGYMGEADIGYYYASTHVFSGLISNEKHVCSIEVIGAKDPTCTENGYTGDQYCAECERTIYGEVIPATGHDYKLIDGKDATCTEDGKTIGIVCSVCNHVLLEQEIIPATGHDYKTIDGKDATCTEDGWKSYNECSVCGALEAEKEIIPATGHDYKLIDGKDATCTEDGKTVGIVCSVCNHVLLEQEIISATGHDYKTIDGKDATCTEDGWKSYNECSVCGALEAEKEIIPATGEHTYEEIGHIDATCASPDLTISQCLVCGKVKTDEGEPTSKHLWNDGVVTEEATCAKDGTTTYTCTACGATRTETIKATLDHIWSDKFEIVKEATCSVSGIKRYACTTCEDAFMEETFKLEHTWVIDSVVTAPTCTDLGINQMKCSVCGATMTDDQVSVDKAAHTYEQIGHIDATTESAGMNIEKCAHCGDVIVSAIEKLTPSSTTPSTTPDTAPSTTGTENNANTNTGITVIVLVALAGLCVAVYFFSRKKEK